MAPVVLRPDARTPLDAADTCRYTVPRAVRRSSPAAAGSCARPARMRRDGGFDCRGRARRRDFAVSLYPSIPRRLRHHTSSLSHSSAPRAGALPACPWRIGHGGLHGGRFFESRKLQHALCELRGRGACALSAAGPGERPGASGSRSAVPARMHEPDGVAGGGRVSQFPRSVRAPPLAS